MTRPPASGSTARAFLAPPLLWAAHFLAVYVFVSLACLWGWHRLDLLGVPLVHAVVVAVTLGVAGAVLLATRAAARLQGFQANAGVGIGLLFAAATLMVGLPALLAPVCR
jgi:hypothetical protein